jgi:hypothetical protein
MVFDWLMETRFEQLGLVLYQLLLDSDSAAMISLFLISFGTVLWVLSQL